MDTALLSRRRFTASAMAALAAGTLPAQAPAGARLNIAEVERPRVLAEANRALSLPLAAAAALSTLHDKKLLRDASAAVASLAAAFLLTKEEPYARRAGEHLQAWFVTPESRLNPQPVLPASVAASGTGTSMLDLVPLAECARALSFLVDSPALPAASLAAVNAWFSTLGDWLETDRGALLARDSQNQRASAWLLIQSAIARSQRNDRLLGECRKLFKHPTLRNQITAGGTFPHELQTPDPYRNTLFNFDLLAGTCQLLASPFDDLWNFELQDGPGMRAVAAYLFPAMQDRAHWPWVADAAHFRELPGPRPALLFAGRAYNRPEYVELWRTMDAQPVPEDIAWSFPIRQPLLWTARAAHGL